MNDLFPVSAWSIFISVTLLPTDAIATTFSRLAAQSNSIAEGCYSKAGYFGWEQVKCAFAEQNRQAQILARAYRSTRNRAGVRNRWLLAASQRQWQMVVNRTCHTNLLFGPTEIGTIATVDGLMCLAQRRRARIDWLDRQHRSTQRPHSNAR